MISAWKKQFTLKQLSLNHEKPLVFVLSQWQKDCTPSIAYLLYRWFICLTFLTIWILSIIGLDEGVPIADEDKYRVKWLIYLTNWGFTVCMMQSLCAAFLVTTIVIADRKAKSNLQGEAFNKMYKVYWALNVTATDLAIGITFVYWTLLYNPKETATPMNILLHGCNSVLMITDLFILSHPVRLLHCLYPLTLGLLYALFSLIYYAAGGTGRDPNSPYIYPILKWDKPGYAVLTCLGVMAFLVVIHILTFCLVKFRAWSHEKCQPATPTVQITLTNDVATSKPGYVNEAMTTEIP